MGRVLTQVEELPENKVRLSVEVPVDDLKHAVEHAADDLAASVKIPGFRKGKVPRQVLLTRIGRERIMAEAVDSHIGGWYRNAVATSRVLPVSKPEYSYELPESDEAPFAFTATVSIQPKPSPADWTQLEVGVAEPEVPRELVDQELEVLRQSVAPLEPVQDRPVKEGDVAVIDLMTPSESRRDYVVEVGDPRFVDEITGALIGMRTGETRAIEYEDQNGRGEMELTARELHEKVLPPLDDDLARSVSEFDTLAELSADIEVELREQLEDELETRFRTDAIDALVEASAFTASGPLVEARARELLAAMVRSLERRGISAETYLALTNQTAQQLQEGVWAQAAQALGRELILEAVADKAGIEISDDEVRELIREQAEASGEGNPDEVVERIFEAPVRESLREDLRLRSALDRVASEVKRIPADLARAREKLWTPEKEKAPGDTKLWTPATTKEPA